MILFMVLMIAVVGAIVEQRERRFIYCEMIAEQVHEDDMKKIDNFIEFLEEQDEPLVIDIVNEEDEIPEID